MADLRDELAGTMARVAGEEWPPTTGDVVAITYHWLGEANAVLPVMAADREQLARRLDQMATHASRTAQRYEPDSASRISQIGMMRAYSWAARIVRGEA